MVSDAMVTAACKVVFAHDDAESWPEERESIREGLSSALSVMASDPVVRESIAQALRDPSKTYPAMFSWDEMHATDRVLSVLAGEKGRHR